MAGAAAAGCLLLWLPSCVSSQQRAAALEKVCEEREPCPTLDEALVELTERERCQVEAFGASCDPVSRCFANCLLSGEGRLIGGGCYHACGWVYVPSAKAFCPAATKVVRSSLFRHCQELPHPEEVWLTGDNGEDE